MVLLGQGVAVVHFQSVLELFQGFFLHQFVAVPVEQTGAAGGVLHVGFVNGEVVLPGSVADHGHCCAGSEVNQEDERLAL